VDKSDCGRGVAGMALKIGEGASAFPGQPGVCWRRSIGRLKRLIVASEGNPAGVVPRQDELTRSPADATVSGLSFGLHRRTKAVTVTHCN
jgi:hypothetical protein